MSIKTIYKFLSSKFQNLFLEYKVDFKPRYLVGVNPHFELNKIIDFYRHNYSKLLYEFIKFKEQIWEIKEQGDEKNPLLPVWNNGFFPGLDIISLHSLLPIIKPKRYVEIGSGNSTKVVYNSAKVNSINVEIVSIDPMPRAEIDIMVDVIVREPLENCKYDIVDSLFENDILFVDNSHRILPNSDCMVFFLEILPKLRKGVYVHIHDIYLPYDYPQFMCDRFYSEQYGLAMYILSNPDRFEIILPNFFISEDKELSLILSEVWQNDIMSNVERHGGSFWIRVN